VEVERYGERMRKRHRKRGGGGGESESEKESELERWRECETVSLHGTRSLSERLWGVLAGTRCVYVTLRMFKRCSLFLSLSLSLPLSISPSFSSECLLCDILRAPPAAIKPSVSTALICTTSRRIRPHTA